MLLSDTKIINLNSNKSSFNQNNPQSIILIIFFFWFVKKVFKRSKIAVPRLVMGYFNQIMIL